MNRPLSSGVGDRQRALLTLLLEFKDGLAADELSERLGISRSAVHQHVALLEKDGYVEKRVRPSRGGRPGHAWRLTDKGLHVFPKQYAFFSELMLRGLKKSLGSEGLVRILEELGAEIAREHAPRLDGRPLDEQIRIVADVMQSLGYAAGTAFDGEGSPPAIVARNCVYHDLAREHSEVCRLDLALLRSLLGADIEHAECMVRGGLACRFRVRRPSD